MAIDPAELRRLRDNTKNEHYKTLSQALDRSVMAIEQLRAALTPFAYYYDLNDCHERDKRGALEVPISDLRAAKKALE